MGSISSSTIVRYVIANAGQTSYVYYKLVLIHTHVHLCVCVCVFFINVVLFFIILKFILLLIPCIHNRYPKAWTGSTTFFSTTPFDPFSWTRKLDTIYDEDAGTLSWTHTHEPHYGGADRHLTHSNVISNSTSSSSVYFAYFPPYSYQRHLDLIARCSSIATSTHVIPNMSVYSLGQTLDGREMDCIQIGRGPRICWIIHRQHPGETMAEFNAEVLLQ